MTDTPFRKRVYDALRRVPPGYVTTYKALAAAVGCSSPRAVGQAMKRNPYAPEVPCHRVIASDLTIGGFQGQRDGLAIRRKSDLLKREGVRFEGGHLVDARRCLRALADY
jgi:methylated-DNA-[protein]-cysteine S-methyltransferase